MDEKTVFTYNENYKKFINQYQNTKINNVYSLIDFYFHKEAITYDIGCASGRDFLVLKSKGYKVKGIDATSNFVNYCKEKYPNEHFTLDSLPSLNKLKDSSCDNLLLNAVLMHIKKTDLIEAISNLFRVLTDKGRMVITWRKSREISEREQDQRLYTAIDDNELIELFESFGGKVLYKEYSVDQGRKNIKWLNLVIEKKGLETKSGIDRIQEIIIKDKKDTSYKLALLRAIIYISRFEKSVVTYRSDENIVLVPMKRIAYYWVRFYFPLVKGLKIKQSKSHNRLSIEKFIEALPYNKNSLSRLIAEYENGINRGSIDKTLKLIADIIFKMPMKFAGKDPYSVFNREKIKSDKFGFLTLNVEMWKDFSSFGYLIEDSLLIRWATQLEDINKKNNFGTYFYYLNQCIDDERSTQLVRRLFKDNKLINCTWTGNSIKKYEVDHAIPWSVWKNNDLWNLFPMTPKLNSNKSNKIPSTKLFLDSKERILDYWDIYEKEYPEMFSFQINKALNSEYFKKKEVTKEIVINDMYKVLTELEIHSIADTWEP